MEEKFLSAEIYAITKQYINHEQYDDAIFHVTKHLEVVLQQIGNTKSINTRLVKELKDNNIVKFSENLSLNDGVFNLLKGIFQFFRNDRGHDKTTTVGVDFKCKSKLECIQILGFIDYMLKISVDYNLLNVPKVSSYSYTNGMIHLIGSFPKIITIAIVNETPLVILQQNKEEIFIDPGKFRGGSIFLSDGLQNTTIEIEFVDIEADYGNTYMVREVNIPLFSDQDLLHKYENIKGVGIVKVEARRENYQILPTNQVYEVGQGIKWGFLYNGEGDDAGIGPTWIDQNGQSTQIYSGSLLFNGEVIGKDIGYKSIVLLPSTYDLDIPLGEYSYLGFVELSNNGAINKFETAKNLQFENTSSHISHITNTNIILAKKIGNNTIKASKDKLHSIIKINIITRKQGIPYILFYDETITRLQEIAVGNENIYICNQSNEIYVLNKGGISCLVKITEETRIDFMKFDATGNRLFFSGVGPNGLYSYDILKGTYKEESLGDILIRGFDILGDNIFFTNLNKEIGIYNLKTKDISYFSIPIGGMNVYCFDDKVAIIGGGGSNVIFLYNNKGEYVQEILFTGLQAPTGIVKVNEYLYVIGFHCGNLYSYNLNTEEQSIVYSFGEGKSIGGLTTDEDGNLYISIFSGQEGKIYKISP